MAEAVILERHGQVAEGDKLNSKATQEIEALLEHSEQREEKKEASPGHWYFKMPMAGVRYYSF